MVMSLTRDVRGGFLVIVVAAVGLWWPGGCARDARTARWKTWEYDKSQARTAEQQLEAHLALQRDHSPLTGPVQAVPAEMPSNMLTEGQRRAVQQEYAELMRQRAEEQARAAELDRRQPEEMRPERRPDRAKR
jgi:hypothetical protein